MKKVVLFVVFVVFASAATITVQLNNTKPSGLNWDGPGSGGPDIYVKVNGISYRSDRCQDSYTCTFNVDTVSNKPLSIEVWDADFMDDDYAGSTICSIGDVCTFAGGKLIVSQ